ncbi:hypothetical protein [Leptolyngbya ohadii]|uniref:hypothetical protein n=1 Tax=Leptolyngbya ohadii TaxID=1962290 RepID=UPI000B599A47|nr:hypothetical protein [Leptolyngbya ohadii]
MSTTPGKLEITAAYVQNAVDVILKTLGEPQTAQQKRALQAFRDGDSTLIKRLSIANLQDNYIKCLGYLISAPKLTPQTDTILAESARSAADHVRDLTLINLSNAILKDEMIIGDD